MLQRLIAAVLGVLGLLAIGLGVASSTVWRGDDVLVATASPEAHLVVTDPGVLELAGDPVTVTVRAADGGPVVIAVGRDTDVAGWVGTDAHAQVTGLASWHALRTQDVTEPAPTPATTPGAEALATAAPATDPAATEPSASAGTDAAAGAPTAAVDPSGSDLWVAQATGDGSATLTWSAQPGRWSLLVASLGTAPPVLELAWPRTVTTPWLWPGVVGGALLLVAGLALGARLWLRARRGLTEPEWHPVLTGAMPTVAAPGAAAGAVVTDTTETVVLTRRQMREAEAAHGAATRRRGRGADAPATGAQPVVTAGVGRDAPREAPAQVGGARLPASSDLATAGRTSSDPTSSAGPVPADLQPTDTPDAVRRADLPRGRREAHVVAGPAPAPYVNGPRTPPARPSDAPLPARPEAPPGAPPRSGSGLSTTAPLPSYFQRANVPAAERRAVDAPVAPSSWVPDGAHRGPSQHAAGPGMTRPLSPQDPAPQDPARQDPARQDPARQDPARSDAALPGASWSGTEAAGRSGQRPAPRPTWTAGRPVIPDEPAGEAAVEPPGARADAWRRAWGFPGHDAGGSDDATAATDEGTHR